MSDEKEGNSDLFGPEESGGKMRQNCVRGFGVLPLEQGADETSPEDRRSLGFLSRG